MKLLDHRFQLPINPGAPRVMHVDLNSCFATIEQQANPLIRGKPVAVAPYTTPRAIIIAPSIEAKALGIKLGMRIQEAREICPGLIVMPPDPPKYRDAHQRFKKIFMSYTNNVAPKSIDEAVIDFNGSPIIEQQSMEEIGLEIKRRIKEDIGEWVRVNVGISNNRFLAKLAAGLHKPDGLDVITKDNLLDTLSKLDLVDLPGINVRYEARLNTYGIYTPLQFFEADLLKLQKQVFRSIVGYYWYLRLRGWEIDAVNFGRKSFGHTYALKEKTADREALSRLLMKLCEKTGRRLRRNNYCAEGVHISCLYEGGAYWHKGRRTGTRLYSSQEIYLSAQRLLNQQPDRLRVTNLAVSVYDLQPYYPEQIGLFDGAKGDVKAIADACDLINDKYGEFVITPALMMGMDKTILDRVAFGGVKDLEDLYGEAVE